MRKGIGVFGLLLTLCVGATPAPPRPGPNVYVADYAKALSSQDKATLMGRVGEQNSVSDAHLFVVSVKGLKLYGQRDVREAAKVCFSEWDLGEQDVLLFLSLGEKKARIHTGGGWSRRWDLEMQRIQDEEVDPACDRGECGRALMQASERLLRLTGAGPSASLPARNWKEKVENLGATASSRSGLPWKMCLVFMASGMALLLCSLLPMGLGGRVFSATLGLVLLVSCYSAQGVLSAFWVLLGAGLLWGAGATIQAGYQAGPMVARGGDDSSDSSYSADYFGFGDA